MCILLLWLKGMFLIASWYSIEIDLLHKTIDLISSSNDEVMDHRDIVEFLKEDNKSNPGLLSESEEERMSFLKDDDDKNNAINDYGSDSDDDFDFNFNLNKTSEHKISLPR